MEAISLKDIIAVTGGTLLCGSDEKQITSVQIDSRKLCENSLFVPIKGEVFDGHDFINTIEPLGAVASLTEKNIDINNFNRSDLTIIKVNSTKKALQKIAKFYKNRFKIPFIGVTGSVGKSTTKEMIAAALSGVLNVFKSEGNLNSQLGLPLTLFNLNKDHQIAVVEMGISEFGEMDNLADIIDPDFAVITNIGYSHLETLKTQKNIRDEKLKILKKPEGKLYLNGDNTILFNIDKNIYTGVTYFGLNGNFKYKAECIHYGNKNTSFVLVTNDFRENIEIPCLGIHNVCNALAAIAVAMDVGLNIEDIKKGLSEFKNLEMRQQIQSVGSVTLIDDTYNASPDSVKGSIRILKTLDSPGKNIVVMADMLELGDMSEKFHLDIGKYIAFEDISVLITVGEMSQFISKSAQISNQITEIFHCKTNLEAAEILLSKAQKGDKILIKGSRGMKTEEIALHFKENFEKTS